MNSAHLHLLLNHFPVIGTLIGSGLLLWGILKKQDNLKSIAASLLVIFTIIAIPVYLTGEPAEEAVEHLPGVAESLIEQHESAASVAMILMAVTGLVALFALVMSYQRKKATTLAFSILFLVSAICFGSMALTGYYGGQIRHSEISSTNATGNQEKGNEAKSGGEKEQEEQKANGKEKDND